jgi:nitronate monooxygenase
MLATAFTRLAGCRAPIQQAPMGTVSGPDLAVAVAEAGGVGTITALGIPAAQLDGLLAAMAKRTSGVLAANFLTAGLDRDALAVAAERVRLIDFFWVDPAPALVEVAHAGGALASWQVGSVEEAQAAVDAGADVIAVQGTEAGGHIRGRAPLLPLLSSVLERVQVPVLAAGGIGDGRSLAAVLAAGAAGARIGTRFIATTESGAHPAYKQAVVAAGFGSTEITDAFADCPLCATDPRARVLRSCIDAVHRLDDQLAGETIMAGQPFPVPRGSGLPPGAGARGHIEAMAMYAGEAAASVTRVAPVREVVEELLAAAEQHLQAAAPRTTS